VNLSIEDQRTIQDLDHRITTLESRVSHLYQKQDLEVPAAPPPPTPVGLEKFANPVAPPPPPALTAAIAALSPEQKAQIESLLSAILAPPSPPAATTGPSKE
jgi:hypothetical protein